MSHCYKHFWETSMEIENKKSKINNQLIHVAYSTGYCRQGPGYGFQTNLSFDFHHHVTKMNTLSFLTHVEKNFVEIKI